VSYRTTAIALAALSIVAFASCTSSANTADGAASNNDIAAITKSAEEGDAEAQFNLALRYADGGGIKQDDAEAIRWYRKSADQGFAPAQLNFGNRYRTGQGIPQDESMAVLWYRKAAEQGLREAEYNLAVSYRKGTGITQSPLEAIRWYKAAADQGHTQAQGRIQPGGVVSKRDWHHAVSARGDSMVQSGC